MFLKVGDKVMLREDSEWNNGRPCNPIGVVGEVCEIVKDSWLSVRVKWSGGAGTNSYHEKDLSIVPEEVSENPWDENPLYFGYIFQWEPERNELVYTVDFMRSDFVWGMRWTDERWKKTLFDRGLIFQTEKEAREKAKKMLEV